MFAVHYIQYLHCLSRMPLDASTTCRHLCVCVCVSQPSWMWMGVAVISWVIPLNTGSVSSSSQQVCQVKSDSQGTLGLAG